MRGIDAVAIEASVEASVEVGAEVAFEPGRVVAQASASAVRHAATIRQDRPRRSPGIPATRTRTLKKRGCVTISAAKKAVKT
ncbi:MAG TPA: hypothetical protein VF904_09480 [Anaeromyxobacteraceae bacterium]